MKRSILGGALAVAVMALTMGHANAESRLFVAQLALNPDVIKTHATGKAEFRLSEDGTQMQFEVVVENLELVTEAHVHLTQKGLAEEGLQGRRFRRARPEAALGPGPTVVFLLNFTSKGVPGNGVLASGTITEADLVGPLKGYGLDALVTFIEQGHAYVNIHTLQRFGRKKVFCCPTALAGTIRPVSTQ